MKIDRVAHAELDGRRRLSARVRPERGEEYELWFEVPQPFGGDDLDASPFLAALLPIAMTTGERIDVDGCVSPKMLGALDDVMRVFASLYPDALKPVAVRAETAVPSPGPATTTCFFSRGVDSWHSVLTERRAPSQPALTHLVYVDGVDVLYDEPHKAAVSEGARAASQIAGFDVILAATNIREHTDPVLDWSECHGPALAGIALALRPARSLTPSGFALGELMPSGSHFYLDYRFSTEHTAIEVHGEATRAEKVARLVAWPEAIATLRLCLDGNLSTNCGDCAKCVHTMLEMKMAGGDPRAASFLRPLTPARVASVPLRPAGHRIYLDVLGRIRRQPEHAILADAFELAVRRLEARMDADALCEQEGEAYREAAEQVTAAADMLDAEALAAHRTIQEGAVGLIRAVDRRRHRHVYGFGWQPAGTELAGELGSLLAFRHDDSVAVWVDICGGLQLEDTIAPGRPRPARRARMRFLLAPLTWKGGLGAWPRVRAVAVRAGLLRSQPAPPAPAYSGEPVAVGYLYTEAAEGRRPLYAARHPVTGDQLLTNFPPEAADMGYGEAVLLGYLVDRAPVTGQAGIVNRPEVAWASRLGQRVRPLMQAPGMS